MNGRKGPEVSLEIFTTIIRARNRIKARAKYKMRFCLSRIFVVEWVVV